MQHGGDAYTLTRLLHRLAHNLTRFPEAVRGNRERVLGGAAECVARGDGPERALFGRQAWRRQLRHQHGDASRVLQGGPPP
eukprot:8485208-Pyramimonas_sp.AAC.1